MRAISARRGRSCADCDIFRNLSKVGIGRKARSVRLVHLERATKVKPKENSAPSPRSINTLPPQLGWVFACALCALSLCARCDISTGGCRGSHLHPIMPRSVPRLGVAILTQLLICGALSFAGVASSTTCTGVRFSGVYTVSIRVGGKLVVAVLVSTGPASSAAAA